MGLRSHGRLLFFLVAVLLALETMAMAIDEVYTERLVNIAMKRGLYEESQWLALLHYKPSLRGYVSLIDDPDFFASPAGKYDPRKELEATIRAFFAKGPAGDEHPRCRFIARYKWLKDELPIDETMLGPIDCSGYNELTGALRPSSAVLIFPVSHMNSPASMFGHTLLRVDSPTGTRLMSYAVNYSAITRETNGVLFAFKGIFGFYEGLFSILPYYDKIKEYSELESRDMWEYRLNLTEDEVRRMVDHIWELKDIHSYYYFFDENCSYNLLLLIEAARPSSEVTEALPAWVIPADTVKAVKVRGLYAGDVRYRPALATRINYMTGITGEVVLGMAAEIGEGSLPASGLLGNGGIPREEKIKALDLATEYLRYRYAKRKVTKDDYQRLYLEILSSRSTLGKGEHYEIPEPHPPDEGHGSFRMSIGAGARSGETFQSLAVRPANHDLLDPDEGYLEGSAISFLDTELRYNYTERKPSLDRLTIIGITSLAERGRFFRPVSWKVAAGLKREEFRDHSHGTVFSIEGGPGVTYRVLTKGLLYAFIGPEAKFGGGLENSYALGGRVTAGLLRPLTGRWKAQFQTKASTFGLGGDSHRLASIELNQRFTLNSSNALRLDLKRERFNGLFSNEVSVAWLHYF